MKMRMMHRLVAAGAALCLTAGLWGCSPKELDASQLLSSAQQALSNLNSYALRMSVDMRATPASGDEMEQTSIALDTYTEITTGCQAMYRSAQYSIYKDWLWSLIASSEYQFPEQDGMASYYYSGSKDGYFLQQRQAVDYTLDLPSFFGEDLTATATRYDGEKAYLLTASLADAHLEQLLPPDGDVAQVLRQVPLTATVAVYLEQDTLEPLSMSITCTEPDNALLEALHCPGGTLNICRLSFSFSSLNGLNDLTLPEELADAKPLDPNWAGPPRDEQNAVVLEKSGSEVHIPIPATYTEIRLASTESSLLLRKFTDGHTIDVTYRLTQDEAELHPAQALASAYAAVTPGPKGQKSYADIQTGVLEPISVGGRTVEGEYITYRYTDESLQKNYVVEYSLWTQLSSGVWVQCLVTDSTANQKSYKLDAQGFAQLLFEQIT